MATRASLQRRHSLTSRSSLGKVDSSNTMKSSVNPRASIHSIDEKENGPTDKFFRTGSRKIRNGSLRHFFVNKRVCFIILVSNGACAIIKTMLRLTVYSISSNY